MEYLFVLAGGFSALIFFILLVNKGKRNIHRFLAIILFLVIVNCYYVFQLYHNNGDYYVPLFSEFNFAIPLLYGLFLWFYARSLVGSNFYLKAQDYLHFIPFSLFLGYLLFPFVFQNKIIEHDPFGYPLIKLIVNPIYIFLTFYLLKRHRDNLFEQYSYINHMYHYWLQWITYGALLLWIIACLGNVFNWFNFYDTKLTGDYFLISFLAIFLFILAFIGFNRTQIFQPLEKISYLPTVHSSQNLSSTEETEYERIYKEIRDFMINEKPHLDPKLSLHKLSILTKTPVNKLSYIINKYANQNFYEFVNYYRIEDVKKKLIMADLDIYSILGIALDCGFNSKASFNRIFKKMVGMTPSDYIKMEKKNQAV